MEKKIYKKIIMFDIDNTICITRGSNYQKSKPRIKIIKLINDLYKKNYYIKIFTARYMGRNKENSNLVKKKYYKKTFDQLSQWGVKFHKLIMGKPSYDIFIDDKSYNPKDKKTFSLLNKL